MHPIINTAILLLFTTFSVAAQNQRAPKPAVSAETLALYESGEFRGVKYRLMKPIDFDPKRTYPLILSLHGAGGRGSNNIKNLRNWNEWLADDDLRRRHPCFVLAPQSPTSWFDPSSPHSLLPKPGSVVIDDIPEGMRKFARRTLDLATIVADNPNDPRLKAGVLDRVFDFIDTQLNEEYKIDADRVYCIGHSMGGAGTFAAVYQHPDRFAAAIPSAGIFFPWLDAGRLKDVPLWIFHGKDDKIVDYSGSRNPFERLKKLGANTKLTTFAGVGHAATVSFNYNGDDPHKGYLTEHASGRTDKTDQVWDWLFRQKRSRQVDDAALNKERKTAADRPNVLFIAIDDLNDWTDTLKGNPQARTPHMNRLASKGILFANAHCAAPACGPSRSAIMSGIRPSTSGNYINKSSLIHNPILNKSVLLPEFFQQHGYYVAGGGKLYHGYHFNHEIKGRGFDEYFPSKTQDLPTFTGLKFAAKLPMNGWARQADWGPCLPGVTVDDHPDGITANWATKKLRDEELQEPFFLGAGIFMPHLPNYAPQKYFDRFPLKDIKLPEGFKEDDLNDVPAAHDKMAHNPWLGKIRGMNQWKPAIQAYLACTSMVDDLLGRIMGALEKSRYADNTIIVLWSDHGFQLGEKGRWGKYSLWERATRVNLIWVAPGVTHPGTVSDQPVNLLDIYPTLASLTGLNPPEGQLEGHDLSVLMKNPDADWNEATVTTFGYKNYGVRSQRYRYIVYKDGTEELYDHTKDKWEWHNLADHPEYAEVKSTMRLSLPTHHEPPGITYTPPKGGWKPK